MLQTFLGHVHYTGIVCQILNKVHSAIFDVLLLVALLCVRAAISESSHLCKDFESVCFGKYVSQVSAQRSLLLQQWAVGGHPLIEPHQVFSSFLETDRNEMFKHSFISSLLRHGSKGKNKNKNKNRKRL